MSTYNSPTDVSAGALAKSSDLNNIDAATAAAFALLPTNATLNAGTVNFAVDTGTANSYLVALPMTATGYTDGLCVIMRPLAANTGACTINVDSLGVKSIKTDANVNPAANDLLVGVPTELRYSTITGCFHITKSAAAAAVSAAASVVAAAASASAASSSASAASSSASAASISAAAAVVSQGAALTSANTASGHASTATTQAGNASSSASAAAGSAVSAAASYDSFDDRYLGAKAADPALDNDGAALITGALYFNTVSTVMKVYSGSAWLTIGTSTLTFTGGTNTFNISNGTASLDIAAGATLNIDTSLQNTTGAGILVWPAAGATLTIPTGGGTLGTAAFTAATAYATSGHNHSGTYDPAGTGHTEAAAHVSSHESTYSHANYNTAYGWGNHAGYGYITSAGTSAACSGNAATASSSVKFMSTSHAASYWLVNNWDGTYWDITSNHGSGVKVAYATSSGTCTNLSGGTVAATTITATGNITAYYSDARLKDRGFNIQNALSKVCVLDGFHYRANKTAQDLGYEAVPEVGVSAQQVQQVLPEAIAPAPIDPQYMTVRYEKLIPLLIEAIKELTDKVNRLEGK
jgi:hypothetical protein